MLLSVIDKDCLKVGEIEADLFMRLSNGSKIIWVEKDFIQVHPLYNKRYIYYETTYEYLPSVKEKEAIKFGFCRENAPLKC